MAENEHLAALLDQLGWNAGRLAHRLAEAGHEIDRTTPWYWIRRGTIPSAPIAQATASILSSALGQRIQVAAIWPGAKPPGQDDVTAPWSLKGLLTTVEPAEPPGTWVVTGDDTGALITGYESAGRERWQAAADERHAPDDILAESIEESIPLLRRMDDRNATMASLIHVDNQVRAVAQQLRLGAPANIQQRLLTSTSHLCQLAGWIAFELGKAGPGQAQAQRYLLNALRAAQLAGDRPLAAHALADLSYQAAVFHLDKEATQFARGAERAVRGASALAIASVAGRSAFAHATAGDEAAFIAARSKAEKAMENAADAADAPWAYYLTPHHLKVQMGYSLIALGRGSFTGGSAKAARRLVTAGAPLLAAAGREGYAGGPPCPRKAAFELAWVALGYVYRRDLEAACTTAARALAMYEAAPTPRAHRLLSDTADLLGRRQSSPWVRSLLPQLRTGIEHPP
ncbi:hypothetical protein ACFC1B_06875 [Streptomyces xiamenensis]|uniref:hypothetical protein n=1 Tax=Streptomyces xiamenensis TaxID=408015 RepID=UPI0035E29D66